MPRIDGAGKTSEKQIIAELKDLVERRKKEGALAGPTKNRVWTPAMELALLVARAKGKTVAEAGREAQAAAPDGVVLSLASVTHKLADYRFLGVR